MGKTIAINPSWYWPDDVPRLIGIPPFFCDHMTVGRWAKRRPDTVALADADESLTYAELWTRVRAVAAGLQGRLDGDDRVAICGPDGIDGVVSVIGALAARVRPLLLDAGFGGDESAEKAAAIGAKLAVMQSPAGEPSGMAVVELADLEEAGRKDGDVEQANPGSAGVSSKANGNGRVSDVHEQALDLVTPDGWLAGHSHYSLVSGALSMAEFLQLEDGSNWLSAMPLWGWEGLYSVLVPLYMGATAVVAGADGADDGIAYAVDDHSVTYTILPYDRSQDLARRRPKRLVDAFKRNLDGLMLTTDRPFSPNDRRKLRKTLDTPVLTVFGMTETGPILASHPSWYVDESIGIPVTNVEVQPANPQTGEPLDTMWELLDYATMVIRAPLVMATYEGAATEDERLGSRLEEGWFRTWAMASFDANGMMYLVDG